MLEKLQKEAYESALEYTANSYQAWFERNSTASLDHADASRRIYCFFEEGFMGALLKDVPEIDPSELSGDR